MTQIEQFGHDARFPLFGGNPLRHPRPVKAPKRFPRQSAFTVLELMLAIAIVGVLAAIAVPSYQGYRQRISIMRAVLDIGAISTAVKRYQEDFHANPPSLAEVGRNAMRDPWGNAYQYVNHEDPKQKGKRRKDKRIVPINTDFDVFSMGKDGKSVPPLTGKSSRDDIVRANDGAFIGLASDYDP